MQCEPLSLVMPDIDHLKTFNDTWGRLTGDQVFRCAVMGKELMKRSTGQNLDLVTISLGVSTARKQSLIARADAASTPPNATVATG
jgi:diguanylate cyclase